MVWIILLRFDFFDMGSSDHIKQIMEVFHLTCCENIVCYPIGPPTSLLFFFVCLFFLKTSERRLVRTKLVVL